MAGKEPVLEVLGFVILVLGLIGAGMLRRHLREAKLLRLRQIIHEERLKATEHDTPLPEVDDMELAARLREKGGPLSWLLPSDGRRGSRGGVCRLGGSSAPSRYSLPPAFSARTR